MVQLYNRKAHSARPRVQLRPDRPYELLTEIRKSVGRELWSIIAFSLSINLLVLATPIYLIQVFDRVLSSGSRDTLLLLTLIAVGALIVYGVLGSVRRRLLLRIARWIEREFGAPLLDAAASRLLRTGKRDSSDIMRALSDVTGFFRNEGITALLDVPCVIVFILFIGVLHPALGLYALLGAILVFGCALANEALTRPGVDAARTVAREAQIVAGEAVGRAEAAAAMGMRTTLLQRWYSVQSEAAALTLRLGDNGAVIVSFAQFLRVSLQVGIIGLGAWLVLERSLTFGGMMAASILLGRVLAPLDRSLSAWKAFQSARTGLSTIRKLFDETPDRIIPQQLPRAQGHLEIEDVTLIPPGAEVPVLRNISFSLGPGEVLGIVGASGAGKSSLARLMVGVWQPERGSVRLDGASFAQWDDDQLGHDIGFLPQFPSLLTGTCAENIARMREPDPEALVSAARLAGAHEILLRLRDGYDTRLRVDGPHLSGGEQKLIALARAFYGDPVLVVLDEPDSYLDANALQHFERALLTLRSRGSAVAVISHRPATLHLADRLLLLSQGEVAALGMRDEVQPVMASMRPNLMPLSDGTSAKDARTESQRVSGHSEDRRPFRAREMAAYRTPEL